MLSATYRASGIFISGMVAACKPQDELCLDMHAANHPWGNGEHKR